MPNNPADARKRGPRNKPQSNRHRARNHTVAKPATRLPAWAEGRPCVIVDPTASRTPAIRATWLYDSMIVETMGDAEQSASVLVFDTANHFLGSAIINPASKIRLRMFSLTQSMFDADWIRAQVSRAVQMRRQHFAPTDSFRVIFGEADGLPGVVADKFGEILVLQILTKAADSLLEPLMDALAQSLGTVGTVVRRDAAARRLEGLDAGAPLVLGSVPTPVRVELDGVVLFADVINGQKTGLYLDQRYNRRLVTPFCRDARVLDLFCHAGGWGCAAHRAGAKSVVFVDSSADAIALAKMSAEANGLTNATFIHADAFEFLQDPAHAPLGDFDVLVCDPPAFAKNHKQVEDATRGYLSLNYRAMKRVPVGGVLATCSCSQRISEIQFERALETAARNARHHYQIVARGGQPPDHPELLGFAESRYLKCLVAQRTQ